MAAGIGASAPAALAQSYQPPFVFLSGSETAVVDVSSFASRAERWSDAQTRHRDDAIERAEALAALQRRMEAEESESAEESEAAEEAEAAEPEAPAPAAPAPAPTPPAPTPPAAPAPADPPADDSSDDDGDAAADFSGVLWLPPPADGPSPEQWLAMRHCESRHNYEITSPSGAYRGAWQFSRRTWDWVAGKRGHDHLVGVDPIAASPADQDLMAYELYDIGGDKHWPVCGRHLR